MSTNSRKPRKVWRTNEPTFDEMRGATVASQTEFVMTELDTSITFCEIALSTQDPARRTRNTGNALTGYKTALRFSRTQDYSMHSDEMFQQKLAILEDMLRQLGQQD